MATITRTFLTVVLFTLLGGGGGVANAQTLWASCKPIETVVLPERIVLRCAAAVDGRFSYFAGATTDAKATSRSLSVMEAAQLGDKWVNVLFNAGDTTGGVAFGCKPEDCRPFLALAMAEGPLPAPNKCAFDNNRAGCPGYCSTHSNDRPNCPVQFCTAHPNDTTCPGFCARHPDSPSCDVCRGANSSHNPQCQP